MLLTMWLNVLF